ncbi:MAG: ComF family protein [Firmicutes bacterium]|nr:ComF family protein [[Eubacterium] siraeum]MCM1486900.1 ComF family protein [Bacillota bacterium]
MLKRYIYKRLLLDLFYPNRCGFCGENIPFEEYFCKHCGNRLSSAPKKHNVLYADEFYAVTAYDSCSRPIIHKMKNENNGYALSAVSYFIYAMLRDKALLNDIDVITYIPMSRKDLNHRGYNQTKLIAKELTGISEIRNVPLLKKIKETMEQKKLSAADRRKNLKNAFGYNPKEDIRGKTVLIIDDVCTTGSTLSEAARILKKAGAERVIAAAFAKVVKKS